MRLFLMSVIVAVGLTHPVNAEPTHGRTCRIVFPERPNDSPKIAYLFDGNANQQVTLPSMNFSEVISLPQGEITIFMTPSEVTDPKNLLPNTPKLRITEDIQEFYILMSPDPANATLPLRMNMVNASNGKLKAGETLWYNFTDHRIVAKLGDAKLIVNPKSQTVSKDPVPNSGYYKAEFAYQTEGKGELQRITEQQWWHDAASRHIGFIVNSGGKLPKIYFYRDFR